MSGEYVRRYLAARALARLETWHAARLARWAAAEQHAHDMARVGRDGE